MIGIRVRTPPALSSLATGAADAVTKVVYDTAASLLTKIRANASTGYHRRGLPHIPGTGPGPNVATGDYRRTWTVTTGTDAAGQPSALVSTNAPQAPRLEYGWAMPRVDAAGRSGVDQPPYPHVRPAVEAIRDRFHQDIRAALAAMVRKGSA